MGRFCGYKYKSPGGGTRVAGVALMIVGALMFLIFVPGDAVSCALAAFLTRRHGEEKIKYPDCELLIG